MKRMKKRGLAGLAVVGALAGAAPALAQTSPLESEDVEIQV